MMNDDEVGLNEDQTIPLFVRSTGIDCVHANHVRGYSLGGAEVAIEFIEITPQSFMSNQEVAGQIVARISLPSGLARALFGDDLMKEFTKD